MNGPTIRRTLPRRHPGRCEDCGWPGQPVRAIRFWNNMRYVVCAQHEREYVRGHGAVVETPQMVPAS